jgi:hypothetical protein
MCKIPKLLLNEMHFDISEHTRTSQNHRHILALIRNEPTVVRKNELETLHGVNSIINPLESLSFDLTNQLPMDPMHQEKGGVAKRCVSYLVAYILSENAVPSIDERIRCIELP